MRILLADDHDLVRDAIGTLLQRDDPDMAVISVEDLPSALNACRGTDKFDVIILDLRMPGMNGLGGARKMVDANPETPVILMSGSASAHDVRAALKIGVKGFVPKTLAGKSLISAIRLVATGETYVPMSILTEGTNANPTGNVPTLTPRESEVLAQLRRGNSNKEISLALNIAETTVKLHIRSLSDKFKARNRTDIVIRAIDAGLA